MPTTARRSVAALAAAIVLLAALVPGVTASPRAGDLHVTKTCEDYHGVAGEYCTFQSSNIKAIERGDRIYYALDAGAEALDTDVAIVAGPGNLAFGHCTLVFASLPGNCTFSGGTGTFTHFHASVAVSVDNEGLWHWNGTYDFGPRS